eukprot:GHRR01025610.1.p3 GENE.GHRR01025610.1~~GHRR01025610.1.p3  ORF type:complete len:128 (+),score=23.47 GHRR01025610.1:531-914(+)
MTAHLITPARGAHFTMYLVQMTNDSRASQLAAGVERFIFVVQGQVLISHSGKKIKLSSNDYAYFPPGSSDTMASSDGAGLCVFERVYGKKVWRTRSGLGTCPGLLSIKMVKILVHSWHNLCQIFTRR